MMRLTSVLQWLERRRESAAAVGMKSAAAAAIEVKRKAERDRVKAAV
jgi:hypothetical protein